jgi:nucleoside-diphosphate-sugar epimerase
MSILITGGAGFIGGWLARSLAARGTEVDIVDDFSRGSKDTFLEELLETDGVELIDRDLLAAEAMSDLGNGYRTIYHLAARVGVQNVIEAPYATLRDNVLLAEKTLDLARRQRILDRFVFASTSEIYAGSLEYFDLPLPTPEDTPIALADLSRPRSSYMLSKLYGEAMTRHAGVPITILRPHNVYGPRMGMAHVVPELLKKAHEASAGGEIEVFSTDHTRTFCFIDDAVEMFIAAGEEPKCRGQSLNVGSQTPEITIGELALIVIDTVATAGSPHRRCPDMSRMTELTGLRATTELQEGIARTYAWYRAEMLEEMPA